MAIREENKKVQDNMDYKSDKEHKKALKKTKYCKFNW